MKYYALINTDSNRIISWCGIGDGVTINLNDNELIHEITQEQSEIIGDKEAEFVIEDGSLIIGQLFDKIYSPLPPTLEEQLTQLKNQLMTADERYKSLDKTTVSLEEIKTSKLAQLEELCEKSIVDGFDHTINDNSYRFSCSINAQANFQGTDTLFKDGIITEAEWTVTNNVTGAIERIMLDQFTFNQIKLQVFTHINSNISKLRNILQPQVESALTNDDVELIVW